MGVCDDNDPFCVEVHFGGVLQGLAVGVKAGTTSRGEEKGLEVQSFQKAFSCG